MKNFLKKLSAFKESKNTKQYGDLDTRFLSFITPSMITVIGIVLYIVINYKDLLNQYFETNVVLNGLILGTLAFTLGLVLYNVFELYRAARFLKRIDRVSENEDVVSDEMVDDMHVKLETRAKILNITNMHDAIDRVRVFSALQFTDNDARIIKSKIGFRLSLARSGVGFLSGLLVMLGLLGTFLGLLITIDAVGAAMGSMSDLGGEGGMANFISSIAAPLQGMGLAFSSSLFGLSGSLLSGFFNHLSGGAQNRFIEDVGRWIDNRIPRFDPAKVPEKQAKAMPSQDDMKSWLLGYVYLANKTNKRLGSLFGALNNLTQESKDSSGAVKDMLALGTETRDVLVGISTNFEKDIQGRQEAFGKMEGLVGSVGDHLGNVTEISTQTKDILGNIDENVQKFEIDTATQKEQVKDLLNQILMMRKIGVKFGSIQKTLTDEIAILSVALRDDKGDSKAVVRALSDIQKTLNKVVKNQKKAQASGLKIGKR